MISKPRNVVLLSMLAVLALCMSASAASATTLYEWKVKGAALKSGSSKEFTLKSASKEVFHINLTGGGAEIKLTSSNIRVRPTFKGSILGGKPGTMEAALEFENVVVEAPANCVIKTGKIITEPIVGEIVENAEAGKGRGVLELLLEAHNVGHKWATFVIEGTNCNFKNYYSPNEWPIAGSALVQLSPQKAEATVGKLLFGTESTKTEYVNSKGEFKTASLQVHSQWDVAMIGEPELELVSKEAFGAF